MFFFYFFPVLFYFCTAEAVGTTGSQRRTGPCRAVSFIQSNHWIFFLLHEAGEKSIFFPKKSSYAIHLRFVGLPLVLKKSWRVFSTFLRILLFFFLWKFTCHSFIRYHSCVFFPVAGKKKQKLSFFILNRFSPKMCKKLTLPGKKKIRYLWLYSLVKSIPFAAINRSDALFCLK